MGMPQIVIYSKPGCCLCEQAKKQLTALQERYEFALREVDILRDPTAYDKFKEEIPVICVDGRKAFKYRLDERRLVRMLESSGQQPRAEASQATSTTIKQPHRTLERTRH